MSYACLCACPGTYVHTSLHICRHACLKATLDMLQNATKTDLFLLRTHAYKRFYKHGHTHVCTLIPASMPLHGYNKNWTIIILRSTITLLYHCTCISITMLFWYLFNHKYYSSTVMIALQYLTQVQPKLLHVQGVTDDSAVQRRHV